MLETASMQHNLDDSQLV
jgi:hypothetical protein